MQLLYVDHSSIIKNKLLYCFRSTSTPATTTTTTTTTTPAPQVSEGVVYANQVQGEIELVPAQSGVKLRYVSVQFSCEVEANVSLFWFCFLFINGRSVSCLKMLNQRGEFDLFFWCS